MVGTAVVALFTTFGASIKASIGDIVDAVVRRRPRDRRRDDFSGAGLSPTLADQLAALPEVASTATMTNAVVSIDGERRVPDRRRSRSPRRRCSTSTSRAARSPTLRPGEIAVSDVYADDHALARGSTLTFDYADGASQAVDGRRRLRAAVRSSATSIMTRADWTPHAARPTDVVGPRRPRRRRQPRQPARPRSRSSPTALAAPEPQTRDEYIDSVGAEVDQMLVPRLRPARHRRADRPDGHRQHAVAVDPRAHPGARPAAGRRPDPAQLRSTVRWESVIVAVFGTIGGLGLGTFLGWGLIGRSPPRRASASFALPVVPLAVDPRPRRRRRRRGRRPSRPPGRQARHPRQRSRPTEVRNVDRLMQHVACRGADPVGCWRAACYVNLGARHGGSSRSR